MFASEYGTTLKVFENDEVVLGLSDSAIGMEEWRQELQKQLEGKGCIEKHITKTLIGDAYVI